MTNNTTAPTRNGITPLVSENEAAKLAGLSVSTLRAWRHQGRGFPFIRMGRSIRYSPEGIQAWISENTVCPAE